MIQLSKVGCDSKEQTNMKQKKLLFTLSFSVVILAILASLTSFSKNQVPQRYQHPLTTPTPINIHIPFFSPQQPKIITTAPKDKTVGVTLNQAINITFDKQVHISDFTVSFSPPIGITITTQNTNATILPNYNFLPGTTYTMFITVDKTVQTLTFTTVSPIINASIDNARSIQDTTTQQNYPDVYVSNRVPYSNSSFTISSDFTSLPQEHYFFNVVLLGKKDEAKKNFVQWLLSIGLTLDQINILDVRFQ